MNVCRIVERGEEGSNDPGEGRNFVKIEVARSSLLVSFQVLEGNYNNPARSWKVLIVLERGPVLPGQSFRRYFERI